MVEVFVVHPDGVLVVVDRLLCEPVLDGGHYASEPDAHPILLSHMAYAEQAEHFHSAVFSIVNKLGKTRKHPTATKAHSPNLAALLEQDFPYDTALDHPEEIPVEYREGNSIQVFVSRYERDPRAREACIHHFGTSICQICGFDFLAAYGEIGREFIHVHHLRPLANSKDDRLIDPVAELLPVCPNCHAMLHTRKPNPWTPEELAAMMAIAKTTVS
ncbi:MAG: HNH endonuclease [Gallionellaceae bacterium]|nr:HNH endonuclease [Gallionellaceae bacterium]